jgi:hypothetical protein
LDWKRLSKQVETGAIRSQRKALTDDDQLTGANMYERKSVAILWWENDVLNRSRWILHAKITWSQYQQYAKTMTGEGKDWKAVII